ncbi:GNAT family N-acetyltransferase [Marinobacterium jannaschii]|uniref:GNAT family N-acetyltransferase n=1 Tax=Marinobacterium jannaschii TaxID=64970 RepID=UPI00048684B3|nr:GNAT family N-acetyltransferase [Marinobacterium jannaschii]
MSELKELPPLSDLKIAVFNDFDAARPHWLELEKTGSYFAFQSYDWLANWYQFIGQHETEQLCIASVCSGKTPLMLMPFIIRRQHGLRILCWAGGIVTDYQAPLLAAATDKITRHQWPALWASIKSQLPPFDAARLLNQPEHIDAVENPFLWLQKLPYAESHAALIGSDWNSYYQSKVKKRIRQDSRRQRKRLAEIGEVSFVVAENPQQAEQFTRAMIEQKRRRYHETGVTDILAADSYQQFYLSGGQRLIEQGKGHICALLVDDQVVATHWGILQGRRFYFLMPTYAGEDWKRYSPGRILLEELMQWCIREGYDVFDFSLGGEQYKQEWCNQQMPLYETLDANSIKGHLYLLLQGFKRRLLENPQIFRQAMKLRHWLQNR